MSYLDISYLVNLQLKVTIIFFLASSIILSLLCPHLRLGIQVIGPGPNDSNRPDLPSFPKSISRNINQTINIRSMAGSPAHSDQRRSLPLGSNTINNYMYEGVD